MLNFISSSRDGGSYSGDPGIATHTSYARNDGRKNVHIRNDGTRGGGLPRLLLQALNDDLGVVTFVVYAISKGLVEELVSQVIFPQG